MTKRAGTSPCTHGDVLTRLQQARMYIGGG
jgi:hypothetical protein